MKKHPQQCYHADTPPPRINSDSESPRTINGKHYHLIYNTHEHSHHIYNTHLFHILLCLQLPCNIIMYAHMHILSLYTVSWRRLPLFCIKLEARWLCYTKYSFWISLNCASVVWALLGLTTKISMKLTMPSYTRQRMASPTLLALPILPPTNRPFSLSPALALPPQLHRPPRSGTGNRYWRKPRV